MAEYLIIKREKCEHDPATFKFLYIERGGGFGGNGCPICGLKGYTDTHHTSLLDALNEAKITEVNCDCGLLHWGTVISDGVLLEWTCPTLGEQRARNV